MPGGPESLLIFNTAESCNIDARQRLKHTLGGETGIMKPAMGTVPCKLRSPQSSFSFRALISEGEVASRDQVDGQVRG